MISGLDSNEDSALAKFKRLLTDALPCAVEEVRLFGSKARGEGRSDSDLDVLVVVDDGNWRHSDVACEVATDVLLEDGILISPKVISRKQYKDFRERKTPFIQNVIRDGVVV